MLQRYFRSNGINLAGISNIVVEGIQAIFHNKTPKATEGTDESTSGSQRAVQTGRAYDFDGTDDYIEVGATTNELGLTSGGSVQAFTISAWINSDTGTLFRIFGRDGTTNSILFTISAAGVPYFGLYSSLSTQRIARIGTTTISSGTWYHMVATHDGSGTVGGLKIYLNTVEEGTEDSTGTYSGTANHTPYIGEWNDQHADGKLADFRIYNKVLSSDEIDYLYTLGEEGTDPGATALHHKGDEGSGILALDSSGNGYHGTKTGIDTAAFHYEGSDVPYSWQNEVGYTELAHFNNDGYIEVTGMTSSPSYFGACTISAKVYIDDSTDTQAIWSLGGGSYRLYASSSKWYLNQGTDTGVTVSNGYQEISITYDSSGNATSLVINGTEVWTGSAVGSSAYTSFYIGARYITSIGLKLTGSVWDFSLSGSSVKNFSFNGYGNSDADWIDTTGNGNDGVIQSTLSEILIPRNESNTTKDVLGNTLQYTGRVPYNVAFKGSPCGTFDGVNDSVNTTVPSNFSSQLVFYAEVETGSTVSGNNSGAYRILQIASVGTSTRFGLHVNNSSLGLVYNDNGTFTVQESHPVTANTHYKVAGVMDNVNGILKLFVDGALIATYTGVNIASMDASTIDIGHLAGLREWNGKIWNVQMYDEIPTDAELKQLTKDGIPPDESKLEAWFPFSERSGDTLHSVVGSYTATVSNATTTTGAGFWANTQDVFHWNLTKGYDRVGTFDGVDDYVSVGNHEDLRLLSDMSFSLWINPSSVSGQRWIMAYAAGGETINTNTLYGVFIDSSEIWYAHEYNAGTNQLFSLGYTPPINRWTHITVTRNDATKSVNLYVNGVFNSSIAFTNSPNGGTTSVLELGRFNTNTSTLFSGSLAEVRIYNRLLTANEASYIYSDGASGTNPTTTNLVAHYPLKESGTNASDASGNSHDGTIVGDTGNNFWATKIPALADGTSIIRSTPSNPAVVGHNNAETQIDFDPAGAPALYYATDTNGQIPNDYSFGDTLPSPMEKTVDSSVKESQFTIPLP